MSVMIREVFTSNSTITGDIKGKSMALMLAGAFDGATISVQRWHSGEQAYVTVASYTAATATAREILLGKGAKFRIECSSAGVSTDVDADYWFID